MNDDKNDLCLQCGTPLYYDGLWRCSGCGPEVFDVAEQDEDDYLPAIEAEQH